MPRYKMQQRLLSIGEDFAITDEQGRPAYEVDGKILRFRETFVLTDTAGNEVATIRERKLAIRDSMNILRGGDPIATIQKALFSPFRTKFSITLKDGQDLEARGNIVDHEYTLERDGTTVAQISKHWFTLRDTYGIDIAAGEDVGLLLAIAVAIDEMAHDPDEGKG